MATTAPTMTRTLADTQAMARHTIVKKYNAGTVENPLNRRRVDKGNAQDNDGNANAWNDHMLQMSYELAHSDATIESQWDENDANISTK